MEESNYTPAGVGGRLVAFIIDSVIVFPLFLILGKLLQASQLAALLGALLYGLVLPVYNILLLGWFGQTVGKKALGIRVELLHSPGLTWKAAFLRHSVDLLFALLMIASWMSVLIDSSAGSLATVKYYPLLKTKNVQFIWVNRLWIVWLWGQLFSMMLNSRRRALHDYIAGTWVIQTRLAQP
jgi:uncharacterized RDD family membrane protein YckC